MGKMMRVRTTMQPDVDLRVDEAEYENLRRQGLIAKNSAAATSEKESTDVKGGK